MRRLAAPLLLVIAAAVVGFVLARSGGSSSVPVTLSRTASTAAFSVRYPSNWTRGQAVTVPGVLTGGAGAVGLAPSTGSRIATGEQFTLGTSPASGVGALPPRLVRSLSGRAHAATVKLGGRRFSRYLDLHVRGQAGVTSLYLLATTRDTIAAACVTPSAGDSFVARCEQVLATLRLPAGVKVKADPRAAYARGLDGAIGRLDKVRAKAGPGLQAASVAARAHAAGELARAQASAARAIARLAAGPAHAANRRLVGALRAGASDYRALSAAAKGGKRAAYAAASRRLSRDAHELTAALTALATLGYRER